MKRTSNVGRYLFFAVFLSILVVASQSYGNEYLIQIDASAHQKFGLFYPVTYKFAIPQGATALVAQYRYSPEQSWNTLAVKTGSDTFNGINAVRFDFAAASAYVSIAFSRSSDRIYLRMLNGAGNPVHFTFASMPQYYDDRKAAVTIAIDDWSRSTDTNFRAATDYLAAEGLYFTVGLVTGYVDWNSVQEKIDAHGDYLEVASHGASHVCDSAEFASAEIIDSRDAIRNNLTFKGHPHVPVFAEPCGYYDDTLVATVTAGDYLLSRGASNYFPAGSTFAPWDSRQGRYGRVALVFDDSIGTWDGGLLTESNSLFDQAVAKGGIYHLLDHPRAGYWYDGSYLLQHLDHIKGRKNIWYAPLGHLYLYHFVQEGRGNLSLQSFETAAADFAASPVSGAAPLTVTFSDTSSGSITGQLWDFGDSTTSTDKNPVHVYNSPGSYTVKLTVTGPTGSSQRVRENVVAVNSGPVPVFSAAPRHGKAPLTVSFHDTSTGSVSSRLWDFGDSTTSTDANPVHTYQSPGSYTVKLTVSGPGGSNERVERGYVVVTTAGYISPLLLFLLSFDPSLQVAPDQQAPGEIARKGRWT